MMMTAVVKQFFFDKRNRKTEKISKNCCLCKQTSKHWRAKEMMIDMQMCMAGYFTDRPMHTHQSSCLQLTSAAAEYLIRFNLLILIYIVEY